MNLTDLQDGDRIDLREQYSIPGSELEVGLFRPGRHAPELIGYRSGVEDKETTSRLHCFDGHATDQATMLRIASWCVEHYPSAHS